MYKALSNSGECGYFIFLDTINFFPFGTETRLFLEKKGGGGEMCLVVVMVFLCMSALEACQCRT